MTWGEPAEVPLGGGAAGGLWLWVGCAVACDTEARAALLEAALPALAAHGHRSRDGPHAGLDQKMVPDIQSKAVPANRCMGRPHGLACEPIQLR